MTRLVNCYPLLTLPISSSSLNNGGGCGDGSRTASTTGGSSIGSASGTEIEKILRTRDSGDGIGTPRETHSLRRLVLETSLSTSSSYTTTAPASTSTSSSVPAFSEAADEYDDDDAVVGIGYSSVELGRTKVACKVMAPVFASSMSNAAGIADGATTTTILPPSIVQLDSDRGTLYCEVRYCDTTAATRIMMQQQQQHIRAMESDLSNKLLECVSAAVPLDEYPSACVVVKVAVLHDDGSILSAIVAAASLALADANVQLLDIPTCCSVAAVAVQQQQGSSDDNSSRQKETILLADPDMYEETQLSEAIVTLALLPNTKEATMWRQVGILSPKLSNAALNLCRDGCRTMHKFLRAHLVDTYERKMTRRRRRQEEERKSSG